jgi:hypothetical protein
MRIMRWVCGVACVRVRQVWLDEVVTAAAASQDIGVMSGDVVA